MSVQSYQIRAVLPVEFSWELPDKSDNDGSLGRTLLIPFCPLWWLPGCWISLWLKALGFQGYHGARGREMGKQGQLKCHKNSLFLLMFNHFSYVNTPTNLCYLPEFWKFWFWLFKRSFIIAFVEEFSEVFIPLFPLTQMDLDSLLLRAVVAARAVICGSSLIWQGDVMRASCELHVQSRYVTKEEPQNQEMLIYELPEKLPILPHRIRHYQPGM